MKQNTAARALRFAGSAALLALLAASSYAARENVSVPAVPVMVEVMSGQALAAATIEETRERLAGERAQALALLQSVIDNPGADDAAVRCALEEKTQIAARMETEAEVGALLAHMGFERTAVIMGEGTLNIIAPWQTAENEQNRLRMIDAAASQSGLSADAVKIILAKK